MYVRTSKIFVLKYMNLTFLVFLVLNGFESGIFLIKKQAQGKVHLLDLPHIAKVSERKVCNCKDLKILSPKQMI